MHIDYRHLSLVSRPKRGNIDEIRMILEYWSLNVCGFDRCGLAKCGMMDIRSLIWPNS